MSAYRPRTDLARVEGWEQKLTVLAQGWRRRPYAYGISDCGRFAHDAVFVVTGVDLLDGDGWPNGWLGVARWMTSHGWESVEEAASDLLPEMPVGDARRGDVVSFEQGRERHLAVRVGDTALTPGPAGLIEIVRPRWLRAWRVG